MICFVKMRVMNYFDMSLLFFPKWANNLKYTFIASYIYK